MSSSTANLLANPPNTLDFWREQIFVMQSAVVLWDKCREKDDSWLKDCIVWKKGGRACRYKQEWFEFPKVSNPNLQEQFKLDNVRFLARYILQCLINRQLTNQVAPRLLWKRQPMMLDLYFKPLSLIGALWLQFAQDVAKNSTIRWCVHCKKK